MNGIEQAVVATLDSGPEAVRRHPLAATALLLARRLDEGPPDMAAAALSRELRLVLAGLAELAGAGDRDLEEFLDRVSGSPVRNGSL